jgi:hypothetical protein
MSTKGVFDGNCNRTDCQKPIKGNNWWNSSTRAYYCEACAEGHHGINYWSRRDDGITICTKVTSPEDRPAFPYQEMQARREGRNVGQRHPT